MGRRQPPHTEKYYYSLYDPSTCQCRIVVAAYIFLSQNIQYIVQKIPLVVEHGLLSHQLSVKEALTIKGDVLLICVGIIRAHTSIFWGIRLFPITFSRILKVYATDSLVIISKQGGAVLQNVYKGDVRPEP